MNENLMNEDRTRFKNQPMQDDDEEPIHRFFCHYCGSNTLYTEQEYATSIIPLDRLKCNCGHQLFHQREYKIKRWVDKNIRNKRLQHEL